MRANPTRYALVLGALIALPAAAETAAAGSGQTLRFSEITGSEIMGDVGAPVANVNDIVFDATGEIQYLVVEREAVEGAPPLAAVPWEALKMTDEGLTLDVSGKRMAEAPGFSTDNWPDMNSTQWRADVNTYYGVKLTPSEVAEAGGKGPFPSFAKLDANGDGKISPDEVSAFETLSSRFDEADINQNGFLDESEFSAFEVHEGVMPGLDEPITGEE